MKPRLFAFIVALAAVGLVTVACTTPPTSTGPTTTTAPPDVGFRDVSGSDNHTCGVKRNGRVQCWGNDFSGQTGTGIDDWVPVPVDTDPILSATSVSAHSNTTCALLTTGGVKCWGENGLGQLGFNTVGAGVPHPSLYVSGLTSGVVAVGVGFRYACALTNAGAVWCWGNNQSGQLGNGSAVTHIPVPVPVTGLQSGVISLGVGDNSACAVLGTGGVRCWGRNGSGQLGQGLPGPGPESDVPVDATGMASGFARIAVGAFHGCALRTSGAVWCWGNNSNGQVGVGEAGGDYIPVPVVGLPPGVTDVAVGNAHSCAAGSAGVQCWGGGANGRLGNGTEDSASAPVEVATFGGPAVRIEAGAHHTCAIRLDGGIRCWGFNGQYVLGNNSNVDSFVPVDVIES